MDDGRANLLIFSGNGCRQLAERVAQHIGTTVGDAVVSTWTNGEIRVQLREHVRGRDVFIFQSFGRNVNDRVMELLVMLDAARRASAARITVVAPYFPYSKQEKKFRGREPISARLVADLLTSAGATRLLTMDLHEGAIQGFFNIPVDHLPSIPYISRLLPERGLCGPDLVVVAPDEGAVEEAVLLSGLLGCGIAVVFKRHMEASPEAVQTVEVVGDIVGKRALIWDDMILGGSTLVNAADMVLQRGARSVHACITHPVLCGDAVKRIEESNLAELIVTDSIPLPENLESTKITTISISSLLGDAIARISRNDSVSELL